MAVTTGRMFIQALLCCAFAAATAAVAAYTTSDCPPRMQNSRHLFVFKDSCFNFVLSERREFADAERECQISGGHLAVVRDSEIQQFLYSTAMSVYSGPLWIGMNDVTREGSYVWTDGSPVSYVNWAIEQPTGSGEDCVAMDISQGGKWFDTQCKAQVQSSRSFSFICQANLTSSASTTTNPPGLDGCPSTLPRDSSFRDFGSSCYVFHTRPQPFHIAQQNCERSGGHVAVIQNDVTQQFIYDALFNDFRVRDLTWIGLTDRAVEGTYQWLDGTPLQYTNWGYNEPEAARSSWDCVAMDTRERGQWYDATCEDTSSGFLFGGATRHHHPYVCQYPKTGLTTGEPILSTPVGSQGTHFTVNDCPANLPSKSHLRIFGSSCYDFVGTHALTFQNAELECEQRNGHLVIIRDAATQQFVYNTFAKDLGYQGVSWIGLTDRELEGSHIWVDGTDVNYTNWAEKEPTGDSYDCAVIDMRHQGQWYDYRCTDSFPILVQDAHHYFVCEYPISQPSESPNSSTSEPTTPMITLMVDSTTESVPTTTTTLPLPTSSAPPSTTAPSTPLEHSNTQTSTTTTTTLPPPISMAPPTTTASSTPMEFSSTSSMMEMTSPPTRQAPTPSELPTTKTSILSGCPVFVCSLDCGLVGYKVDLEGCMQCECEA